MSLNTHALGLLAEEKIRRFRLEIEEDRRAKEVAGRRTATIGAVTRWPVGPVTTVPWMTARRGLLALLSLIRRQAARMRPAVWGD